MQLLVPKKVTTRQSELLTELGTIEEAAGEQRSFFERIKKLFE